jgi:hypothetical protein
MVGTAWLENAIPRSRSKRSMALTSPRLRPSAFQQAMEHRFIADVERLTGRRVAQFFSTHHVGPDLELELFVLEPVTPGPA